MPSTLLPSPCYVPLLSCPVPLPPAPLPLCVWSVLPSGDFSPCPSSMISPRALAPYTYSLPLPRALHLRALASRLCPMSLHHVRALASCSCPVPLPHARAPVLCPCPITLAPCPCTVSLPDALVPCPSPCLSSVLLPHALASCRCPVPLTYALAPCPCLVSLPRAHAPCPCPCSVHLPRAWGKEHEARIGACSNYEHFKMCIFNDILPPPPD